MKLREIEKSHILVTVERAKWNRTHAARQLGIGIRTLQRKLRKYENEGAVVWPNQGGTVRGTSQHRPTV